MASTDPFQHANPGLPSGESGDAPIGRRLRSHGRRAARRTKALEKKARQRGETQQYGFPAWEGLRPVAMFLLLPGLFVAAMVLTGGGWDPIIMYGIAGLIGLFVAFSTFKTVEIAFVCLLLYIPFSKTYTIPVAPMVNGTNMLIVLGLFASLLQTANEKKFWFGWPPGTSLVVVFAVFTTLSGLTLLRLPGGFDYLRYVEFLNFKSWIDQFILFFIALCCIRDVQMAKRVWIYLMVGSAFVVLYTVPEMFDKMGRSTIEKSRIEGPHQQSNNFGGFVAYTTLPLVAMFVVFIKDAKAWLLSPYFLVAAKILITTFSRGAYVAFAAGALFTGYLKSGKFLLAWALFAISVVAIFPQVLPQSVLARMESVTATQTSSAAPEQLDRSSEVRLIMWRAASRMILENPVLGKGFKAFPKLKSDYTEVWVEEADPHSMYLYLGSQMGLPSVVLFLYIMGFVVYIGVRLARADIDRFSRAVGIGGASASIAYAFICIFGSRAVNSDFTLYFWTYFVVMSVLYRDLVLKAGSTGNGKRRLNAFLAENQRRRDEAAAEAEQATVSEQFTRGRHRRHKRRLQTQQTEQHEQNGNSDNLSARARHKLDRANRRTKRQATKNRLSSRRNR